MILKTYLKLLRVTHYVKNVLVLVPLFFGGGLTNLSQLGKTLLGCAAFCLVSSAVYIFNDILDADKDRLHPTKRFRPIASGAVSVQKARAIAALCVAASLALQFAIGTLAAYAYLLAYIGINALYSLGLKNRPIVDIVLLSSGFLIRVMYGAAISGVEISRWLLLTVMAASFYLGLGKRRNELNKTTAEFQKAETSAVLKFYTYNFLDKNMYVFLTMVNVFYALWAREMPGDYFVWTVPLVIVIFLKYSLDVEGNTDGDPVEVLSHDYILIMLSLVYVAISFALVYWGRR